MTIDGNGSIGAPSGTNIYNASDIRLKQNVSTINEGLNSILALNPVKFNWINNFVPAENGKNMFGFIAQEVQAVLPEAVVAAVMFCGLGIMFQTNGPPGVPDVVACCKRIRTIFLPLLAGL
jgi:hypothetical protein